MKTSHAKNSGARAGLIFAAVIFGLLAWAGSALAQTVPTAADTADFFGTPYGDEFSSVFLNQLFGPLFPAPGAEGIPTVFSSIIGYFNVIMLVVGGILFFYNVTVGILQSAHEGSVLGQRWSSLWAPLRVIFAVGLMVPVPNLGGYNLAQAGVGYLVRGATKIASSVWVTSAELIIDDRIAITTSPIRLDTSLIRTVFDNVACQAIANKRFVDAVGTSGQAPLQVIFQQYTVQGETADLIRGANQGYTVSVGSLIPAADDKRFGICGSYSTPELPEFLKKALEEGTNNNITLAGSNVAQLIETYQDAHLAALERLRSGIYSALTPSVVAALTDPSAPLPDLTQSMIKAVNDANTELDTGLKDVLTMISGASPVDGEEGTIKIPIEGQRMRDNMLLRIQGSCVEGEATVTTCYGEGWIGAGSWYMMIARMNNELASITEGSAGYIGPDSGLGAFILNQELPQDGWLGRDDPNQSALQEQALLKARFEQSFEQATAGLAGLGFTFSTSQLANLNSSTEADSLLELIPGYSTTMNDWMHGWLSVTSPSNWGSDPMMGLTSIGKMMIEAGALLFGVGMAAGGGAQILGFGGTIPSGIATMLLGPATAFITGGGTLAFILPLTPFVFWVMAVSGYFLLVVEAVIAVNLWAIGHMRMDGEGISGEGGRNGWLMLLALLMTPVLMVFGFLVGMTLFRVTSALMDAGIHQAIAGIIGGGIFITLAAMVIYTVTTAVIYMMVLERSFSLVAELPGRVLRWINSNVDLGVDTKTARAGAAAGAGALGAMSNAAGKAGYKSVYGVLSKFNKKRSGVKEAKSETSDPKPSPAA